MWALIEDGSITKIIRNPRGMIIDNIQYSRNIFSLWSKSEREAKGIYEVVHDNTNKKDEAYYTNTNVSYAFADGVVTASYGSATAKVLESSFWTQQDSDDGLLPNDQSIGDIKNRGLKHIKIASIKAYASGLLIPTDWYIIREAEAGTAIPSTVTTHRTAVRTKSNEMEVLVNACNTVDELAVLYEVTEQEDGSFTRPLGEFPVLEH
jgi:hypothetical protein